MLKSAIRENQPKEARISCYRVTLSTFVHGSNNKATYFITIFAKAIWLEVHNNINTIWYSKNKTFCIHPSPVMFVLTMQSLVLLSKPCRHSLPELGSAHAGWSKY